MTHSMAPISPSAGHDPVSVALYGFIATSLLLEFDRLKVFERLAKNGPMSVPKLADDLRLDESMLERALEAAACWGLVNRLGKAYKIADGALALLDPESERYIGTMLSHFDRNTVPLFSFFKDALQEGRPQWHKRAENASHAFTSIFETAEYAKAFHAAMWRLSYSPSQELVDKGLLSETKTLVDLGGGAGAFAIAAARRHPDLQVVVFDLADVRPYCEANIHNAGLSHRVRFVSGDFWKDALPYADTYALGYVLSNWNDSQSTELLRRVHEALPLHGRAIILERLLDENRGGPFSGLMQDLAMMLETGGMHRTETHYRHLLNAAGFGGFQVTRSSGEKHAVIGIA